MKTANFPAKKNIRRQRAADRLTAEIDILIKKDPKDPSVKAVENKLKELQILKTRIASGDVARATMRKKYRGAR